MKEVIEMKTEMKTYTKEEVQNLLKELLDGIYGAYSEDEYALYMIDEFLRKHGLEVAYL